MSTIPIFDMQGKKEDSFDLQTQKEVVLDQDLLSQYILIYQANQRQGTVQTKRKGEVRGGGKKPWKQKGTGRARAGSTRSPLWRGGGTTHGPLPRDHSKKFPKAMSRALFAQVLATYAKEDRVLGLSYIPNGKDKYATKQAAKTLKSLPISGAITLVYNEPNGLFESVRNIPNIRVQRVSDLSTYDMIFSDYVICEKSALSALSERVQQ